VAEQLAWLCLALSAVSSAELGRVRRGISLARSWAGLFLIWLARHLGTSAASSPFLQSCGMEFRMMSPGLQRRAVVESLMLSPDVQRRAAVLRRWMGVVALLFVADLVWLIVKFASWKGYLPLTAVLPPLAWLWLLSPFVVGFSLVYCGCQGATGDGPLLAQTIGWSMVCFFWSLFILGALVLTGGPFAVMEISTTYRDVGIQVAFQVAIVVAFVGAYVFATRLRNSLKPTALVTTSPGFHMRLESPQDQWRDKNSAPLARPVDTSVPREMPQAMPLAAAV
jgi:hypothetical protein